MFKRKDKKIARKTRPAKTTRIVPKQHGQVDYRLLYLSAGLFLFGLLMIYSASAVVAFHNEGSTFHYFFRQMIWLVSGAILAYIAYRFPLDQLPKYAIYIMFGAILSLVLVLVVGEDINGARRWIYFGDFSFQASEFAKLAFVIYLAAWLSRTRPTFKKMKEAIRDNFYNDLLPFLFLMGVVCGLILLQPDLDTTVIIALTALGVYFVAGKDAIHTLGTISIIVLASVMGIIVTVTAEYRMKRIAVWRDFWLHGSFTLSQKRNEAFQVWNGLLAIANGGLFGVGYGASTQKLYYLQETAWTDSIFAVIAEEFGLLGTFGLIIAFLYFMSIGIDIAMHAENKFNALLAVGITTWITLQAFLNIGANLALFPFGGIPLPFISYGGSNTWVVMMGIGLLMNVSRTCKRPGHKA